MHYHLPVSVVQVRSKQFEKKWSNCYLNFKALLPETTSINNKTKKSLTMQMKRFLEELK